MSEPKTEISSATFDILERMAKAHPELAGGYARATAGVDIDLVVAVFANALHDLRRAASHEPDVPAAIAQLREDHGRRVGDLLETTNRYLARARKAEALLRIPSGGDQAFAQWRDSLPKTHWARYDLSACRLGFDAGVELAARWVDQRCSDYVAEHGSYDGSTGQTEFSSAGEEYVAELAEIADGLRALGAKS